jgi:hypothetical protein
VCVQVRAAPGVDKQAILREALRSLRAVGVSELCVQVEESEAATEVDHLASAQLTLEAM